MKALTLWQPWASLVIAGVKPLEFRSWAAPRWIQGQRIVIHAAARKVRQSDLDDLVDQMQINDGHGTALRPEALPLLLAWQADLGRLPLGAGLGTVLLGTPRKAPGWDHWGWPVSDPQPFEPIVPRSGAQGFWNW